MFSRVNLFIFPFFLGITTASLSGPYLMWGPEKLNDLKAPALMEVSKDKLESIFKDTKAVVVFLRNNTNRLDSADYPRFQKIVEATNWSYLPQHALAVDPIDYNANVEIIPLSGLAAVEDDELVNGFKDAVTIYGEGDVLGILASREDDTHFLSKREVKEAKEGKDSWEAKDGDEDSRTTTAQTPTGDETDESFIYLADSKKAILYVNAAPILTIPSAKDPIKLVEHNKLITFDDQRMKGYGRLNIIFQYEREKLFLRFNFTLIRASWTIKSVEVEYKDYKTIMPVVGNQYEVPSAPIRFSYRCSSSPLIFRNGSESLVITDYQVQPWLNGASRFGDVYDCVGFTTAPIWSGVLVSFFLLGILSIGILALMDIKTPNRFESSRSKQLTFTVQE